MKRLIFILPLALFAVLAVAFVFGLRRDPGKLPSMLIDKPLPAFTLAAVRGDRGLASADFQGEPALLNVFASWCVACRIEHPLLMRLRGEGVPIHGLDWKDEPADGAAWLAEHGDPYRLAGNDLSGRTGIDLGVTGVPETFVVDRHGRVRYKHIGPIEPNDWERTILPLMQRLRAES
jgi:cytochrome c biogenesis protein CcmG/thiol:disulfide interchange protein DsbE